MHSHNITIVYNFPFLILTESSVLINGNRATESASNIIAAHGDPTMKVTL